MEEDWRRLMNEHWLRDCTQEWRDCGHPVMRAEWTMDGATTLAEAAGRFREQAEENKVSFRGALQPSFLSEP